MIFYIWLWSKVKRTLNKSYQNLQINSPQAKVVRPSPEIHPSCVKLENVTWNFESFVCFLGNNYKQYLESEKLFWQNFHIFQHVDCGQHQLHQPPHWPQDLEARHLLQVTKCSNLGVWLLKHEFNIKLIYPVCLYKASYPGMRSLARGTRFFKTIPTYGSFPMAWCR